MRSTVMASNDMRMHEFSSPLVKRGGGAELNVRGGQIDRTPSISPLMHLLTVGPFRWIYRELQHA